MTIPADTSLPDEQLERAPVRILDATVALLAGGSFTELTSSLVADRSGVAVRTDYRCFSSKAALVDAVAVLADGRCGSPTLPESLGEVRRLVPGLFDRGRRAQQRKR